MKKEAIINKFMDIMQSETHFIADFDPNVILQAEDLLGITTQIMETGYLAFVPRSYIVRYGQADTYQVFESVSAHTTLVQSMVDRALIFEYGPNFKHVSGYGYREIMEAARRHDLPEIIIGDQPDNGERDNERLAKKETSYWKFFSRLSPKCEKSFEDRVNCLLEDMQNDKSSSAAQILYSADKVSAIIAALCGDARGQSPIMRVDGTGASVRECTAIKMCDRHANGFVRASEMWTIDYFNRKLNKYDKGGFFTAIIVMATLKTHYGTWYHWREQQYE